MSYTYRSLLDLPTEIRIQIFDLVFEIDPVSTKVQLTSTDTRIYIGLGKYNLSMSHSPNYPSHPLFFVSRVVREEARARFWCELHIVGPQLFYRVVKDAYGIWINVPYRTGTNEIGAAVGNDDFHSLMSHWMRRSVRTIRLESALGLDGRFINRSQFPCLERVLVDGVLMHGQPFLYLDADGERRMVRQRYVTKKVSFNPPQMFWPKAEDWGDKYDSRIVICVSSAFSKWNAGMGSREERGFDIYIAMRLYLRYWVGASRRRGHTDLVVDYDQKCLVSRSGPDFSSTSTISAKVDTV